MSDLAILKDLTKTPPPWISYPESIQLFEEIKKAGGNCRFVGGCVRDALLGDVSDDLDVCTDLPPEMVLQSLDAAGIRVLPTGLKHGTVTALIGAHKYEITTLRTDVETFGRHATVRFTKDWQEDAARRDFTINALAMDLDGTLYDFFSGASDLATGHVRFIGDAGERIKEDRLRVLRFFRFFSRYGKGEPDNQALAACKDAAHQLQQLSAERISRELFLLLGHEDPLPSLLLMRKADILAALFKRNVTLGLLTNLLNLPHKSEPIHRLAALLDGDLGWATAVAPILRLSVRAHKRLLAMCEETLPTGLSVLAQKTRLYHCGVDRFRDRVLLSWGANPAADDYQDYWNLIDSWEIPQFPITGKDLMDKGIKPGRDMGILLKQLEKNWIDSNFALSKDVLLSSV